MRERGLRLNTCIHADSRRVDRYGEIEMRYDLRMGKTVLLVAALAGCGGYTQFQPATTPAPPDAFAKTTRVLIERGETIETKDEAAGLVLTKWEENTHMGTNFRYRWNITIANGAVTVSSQCHRKLADPPMGTNNEWTDCAQQSADRNTKAKSIAEAIAK